MDILKQLNDAVIELEAHLCDEIDLTAIARIAFSTADNFSRLFRSICGIPLGEYIRRRRLTLAAYELRDSNIKVIDAAVKYGYDNADAFTKAFVKQHGITPTKAKNAASELKVFPPVSFYISMKGATEMQFKIINSGEIKLYGITKQFTGPAAERFEQEHIMWDDHHEDRASQISASKQGEWVGIWDAGAYSIARKEENCMGYGLESLSIPAGQYAVFTTGYGGFAGEELPRLRELIFDAWLSDSGYRQVRDYEVEIYHLFPHPEKSKRFYEIWIPVEK